MVIGNIRQLWAVEFRNDELQGCSRSAIADLGESLIRLGILTACPKLSGLMSRKAKVFSLSKSLKQGISPSRVSDLYNYKTTRMRTLDDTAKDTGRHYSDC